MSWLSRLLNPWYENSVLRADLDLTRHLADDSARAASILQSANTRLIEEVTALRQETTKLHLENSTLILQIEALRPNGEASHVTG